jgi:transposase
MTASTIGIDISKDHLDAYRREDGASRRFANDKAGHKALIKWLSQRPVERVAFEPIKPVSTKSEEGQSPGRQLP